MRLKILVGVLLTACLCALVFTAAALRLRNNETAVLAKMGMQLPEVTAIQLPSTGGVIPVEIVEQRITASQDTPFGELQFAIKNNTNKSIDAVVIAISSTAYLEGGREQTVTLYKTRNQLIHPDIREMHNQKSIGPGVKAIFRPEPLSH